MVSRNPTCMEEGCKKQPTFGLPGEPAQYCSAHKRDGMIDEKHPRCIHAGCEKQCAYGFPGQRPQYCASHKLDDMEEVKAKKCAEKGCKVRPSFGLPGQDAVYCKRHKVEGMIDVKQRKVCEEEGCTKRPTFGIQGEDPQFCATHKQDGMVDVLNKRCAEAGCNTKPSYGFPGGTPVVCYTHSKEGMENLVSKRCDKEGCRKHPTYGYEGESAKFCKEHKLDGMVDVINDRCTEEGCMTQPSYGISGERAVYCCVHSKEGMENVVSTRCKQEGCTTIAGKLHLKGYCLRCFIYNFPDEKVARGYKVKERHVTDALKPVLEELGVKAVFDKRVGGGWHSDDCCQPSLRRPDVLIDMGTHSIIVEIDENQHDNYSCENKRIMEIFRDLGMRPMVLVRFNPDDYVNAAGVDVRSCFTYHRSSGVPSVSSYKKKTWDARLKVLCDMVSGYVRKAQSGIIPIKEITHEFLFYDDYQDETL